MSDLKRGDLVRVIGNWSYGRYDCCILPSAGAVGTVTGRGLGDLIEVSIPIDSAGKKYGFLLLPEEVEPV
jgi:hypothetical protein